MFWHGPAAQTDQITPQPFGTYTYTIRATGYGVGSTQLVIDKVGYFDGSFDTYHYEQVESLQGTLLKLAWIDQFDNDGVHKATISYLNSNGYPQDRVQKVTYYETVNGVECVKYVDEYQYLSVIGIDGSQTLYTIEVGRYEGEIRISGALPVCTFRYEGTVQGQERLVRCTFSDGTYITYDNDLAQNVYTPSGIRTMSFMYHYDAQAGGIVETQVTMYGGGTGTAPVVRMYKGLADPIWVMANNAIWIPYQPPQVLPAGAPNPQPPAPQNPPPAISNPPANQGWMQELMKELLSKNGLTSKGGGSKKVHTYDQMAGLDDNTGLGLRWK